MRMVPCLSFDDRASASRESRTVVLVSEVEGESAIAVKVLAVSFFASSADVFD